MTIRLPEPNEYVTTAWMARCYGLTQARIRQMCMSGLFKTAHKPGSGAKASWRVLKAEAMAHQFNSHISQLD